MRELWAGIGVCVCVCVHIVLLAVDDVLHASERSRAQTIARHELETLCSLAKCKLKRGLAREVHGLCNRIGE